MRLVPGLGALAIVLCAQTSPAEVRENFESPGRSWQLRDRDCPLQVVGHQRVFDQAHAGSGSERLQLAAGQGTFVHCSHDIPPSRLHAELVASVWIRADRPGPRLLVRAVLPQTMDPVTRRPTSVLLPGDSYTTPGVWQQLRVDNIPLRLQRQVRSLRARGTLIDDSQAYVDLVVLNAYQGPGQTSLWLDDLEVSSHVGRPAVVLDSASAAGRRQVELRGDLLEVDGTPFFARVLRHRGEPLELVRELGFNAVYLDTPATAPLIESARRNQLWLIAGPPFQSSPTPPQQLLAWTMGSRLKSPQLEVAVGRARQVRLANPVPVPIVASWEQHSAELIRAIDIGILGRRVRGTTREMDDYGRWLTSRRRSAPPVTWARVALDADPHWRRQAAMLGLRDSEPAAPTLAQLRLEVWSALGAGARGIFIDTEQPLHQDATRTKPTLVRLLNHELQWFEPWLAAGKASSSSAPDPWRVLRFDTPRSQLLVAMQRGRGQQFAELPPAAEPLSLVANPPASSVDAYRMSRNRLEQLRVSRVPGGSYLHLENPRQVEWIALTQDALVLNHLTRKLEEFREQQALLLQQLAFQELGRVAERNRQLAAVGGDPKHADVLSASRQRLEQARQLQLAGQHAEAAAAADQVLAKMSAIRRRYWEQAVAAVDHPVSSPAVLHFDSLPLHWQMTRQLAASRWGQNLLLGGSLEDSRQVQQLGWQNFRYESPTLKTDVAFALQSDRDGRGCLRLHCTSSLPYGELPPQSPIVIQTPRVSIAPNQLVRLAGWVRVPQSLGGDGLWIHDSLGGRDLGLQFQQTDDWQPFELYRVTNRGHPLRVTFELTAPGEAWLDDITITAVDRTAPASPAAAADRGGP